MRMRGTPGTKFSPLRLSALVGAFAAVAIGSAAGPERASADVCTLQFVPLGTSVETTPRVRAGRLTEVPLQVHSPPFLCQSEPLTGLVACLTPASAAAARELHGLRRCFGLPPITRGQTTTYPVQIGARKRTPSGRYPFLTQIWGTNGFGDPIRFDAGERIYVRVIGKR